MRWACGTFTEWSSTTTIRASARSPYSVPPRASSTIVTVMKVDVVPGG